MGTKEMISKAKLWSKPTGFLRFQHENEAFGINWTIN